MVFSKYMVLTRKAVDKAVLTLSPSLSLSHWNKKEKNVKIFKLRYNIKQYNTIFQCVQSHGVQTIKCLFTLKQSTYFK